MQYKKVFKGYQKSTFDPLVAEASNLGQASTSEVRRNSLRHRRVAPEPRENSESESEISNQAEDQECMSTDESFTLPATWNKETTDSMIGAENRSGSSLSSAAPSTSQVDLFPDPESPAPTTDYRDNDVVSPVDHERFTTTRVAWLEDVEGEQTEV